MRDPTAPLRRRGRSPTAGRPFARVGVSRTRASAPPPATSRKKRAICSAPIADGCGGIRMHGVLAQQRHEPVHVVVLERGPRTDRAARARRARPSPPGVAVRRSSIVPAGTLERAVDRRDASTRAARRPRERSTRARRERSAPRAGDRAAPGSRAAAPAPCPPGSHTAPLGVVRRRRRLIRRLPSGNGSSGSPRRRRRRSSSSRHALVAIR